MLLEGKGGKNRRRGKGDGEESKRELEFKEDGTFDVVLFWM
jgi:translation initiation factor 1A